MSYSIKGHAVLYQMYLEIRYRINKKKRGGNLHSESASILLFEDVSNDVCQVFPEHSAWRVEITRAGEI